MKIEVGRDKYDAKNRNHVLVTSVHPLLNKKTPSELAPEILNRKVEKELKKEVEFIEGELKVRERKAYEKFAQISRNSPNDKSKEMKVQRARDEYIAAVEKLRFQAEKAKINAKQTAEKELAKVVDRYWFLLTTVKRLPGNAVLFVDSKEDVREVEKRLKLVDTLEDSGYATGFSFRTNAESAGIAGRLKEIIKEAEEKGLSEALKSQAEIHQDVIDAYTRLKKGIHKGDIKAGEQERDLNWYANNLDRLGKAAQELKAAIGRRERVQAPLAGEALTLSAQLEYALVVSYRKPPGDVYVMTKGKFFGKRIEECPTGYIIWLAKRGHMERKEENTLEAQIVLKDKDEQTGKNVVMHGFVVYKKAKDTKPYEFFVYTDEGKIRKVYRDQIHTINKAAATTPKAPSEFEYDSFEPDSFMVKYANEYLKTGTGRRREAEFDREYQSLSHPSTVQRLTEDDYRRRGEGPVALGSKGEIVKVGTPEFAEQVVEKERESPAAFAEQYRDKREIKEEEEESRHHEAMKKRWTVQQIMSMSPEGQQKLLESVQFIEFIDDNRDENFLEKQQDILSNQGKDHADQKVSKALFQKRLARLHSLNARTDPEWRPSMGNEDWWSMGQKEWSAKEGQTPGSPGWWRAHFKEQDEMRQGPWRAYEDLSRRLEKITADRVAAHDLETIKDEADLLREDIHRLLIRYLDDEIEEFDIQDYELPLSQQLGNQLIEELDAKLDSFEFEKTNTISKGRSKGENAADEGSALESFEEGEEARGERIGRRDRRMSAQEAADIAFEVERESSQGTYLDSDLPIEERARIWAGEAAKESREARLEPGFTEQGQSTSQFLREEVGETHPWFPEELPDLKSLPKPPKGSDIGG